MIHDTLQAKKSKDMPLISVIIPVYNTQDFVKVCIQSLLDQTYQNFEIICVDDGSTDLSAKIIRDYMCEDSRIKLIQIENHGQGYARNLALKESKGKYVMFMDADDYLEDVTFDLAVTRAEEDNADLVLFDWRYYNPIACISRYVNFDEFFSKKTLSGDECQDILQISPYFTVNKLYRKEFLERNNIGYGEGYLYEDIPFWVNVALSSRKVSLIHSPLYRVTTHSGSSTKTNYDTDIHYKSYIKALAVCIVLIKEKGTNLSNINNYSLLIYFIEKFMFYYINRTPKKLKKNFLKEFVDLLSEIDFYDMHERKMISYLLKRNTFKDKKYSLLSFAVRYQNITKPRFVQMKAFFKKSAKSVRGFFEKLGINLKIIKPRKRTLWQNYLAYTRDPLYNDVILFMGFDHRYAGNSRYLFEEMIKNKPDNIKVFFVTNSPLVPLQHRIKPNSDRANRFIARSKVVIFESWIPLKYIKRPGSVWLQLWHGTPLKKMLFDSNEKEIVSTNPSHKIAKFNDIQRWDYLNVDNPNVESYFHTSFLFSPSKIIKYGYPRVKYLLDKKDNTEFRSKLRESLDIPVDKKVVLYLPTWRDYNYQVKEENFDLDYLLDLQMLKEKLGDDYHIIYKDHAYLSKSDNVDFVNYNDEETQQLLLVADYLVSDYSSAIFDGFALDLPIVLYCNDFERNEESRGVYKGLWNDISRYVSDDIDGVVELIENYRIDENYRDIKEKYTYKNIYDDTMTDFVIGLLK